MALQQLATAAVRLMRVINVTERDADELAAEFRLHPHDREAIFSTPEQPLIRSYQNYVLALLPWPVYDVSQNDLHINTLTVIIGDGKLAIISADTWPPIETYVHQLMAKPEGADSSSLHAARLLLQTAKWTEGAGALFRRQLVPGIEDLDRQAYATALERLGQSLAEISKHLETQKILPAESAMTFRLSSHLLAHTAKVLLEHERAVMRPATTTPVLLPRLVGGYVVVSALAAILTLVAGR